LAAILGARRIPYSIGPIYPGVATIIYINQSFGYENGGSEQGERCRLAAKKVDKLAMASIIGIVAVHHFCFGHL
jgi:hypothetical protein